MSDAGLWTWNDPFWRQPNSESLEFIGRVITALVASGKLRAQSGRRLVAAELAQRLGVLDIDGRAPRPLSLETA